MLKEKFQNTDTNPAPTEPLSITSKTINYIWKLIYKSGIFLFIFVVFVTNLTAVSISLQCNNNETFFYKIASALFAFMFGILYIFMNYYYYRITLNDYPCIICSDPKKLFAF